MTARALSIQQPWAWAITDLDKRVENRKRSVDFFGEVFLHASSTARPITDLAGQVTILEMHKANVAEGTGAMPRGAIVGVAFVCDHGFAGDLKPHLPPDQGRWLEGPYGYYMRDVVKLPMPVPCKGALGFWKVPPDVEAKVRKQLEEIAMPKKSKPKEPAAGDPAANSRADLGYNGAKGEKRLDPSQQRELERVARGIVRATADVEEKASARGSAGAALKAAQKTLKGLLNEQNAIMRGTWQAGMNFDGDESAAGDGADDGEDENGD